ncbi:sugar phosphate isomerase/epimerase family protein [Winogradskyella thalassocola]|uniref:Sugar phosphate isomerase/epimerase n=1 Tax=Winogradskyella thalassocola TaxID=262004 RepID=A0A1G8E1P4_9FLAO|nr:sugar phosphate isomerase/epimerase family protein [Winogradskyella thalassocola]SDH63843.1 Sugar phosphate isomerase/epimerase [Winogradskyella thalassocola]
MSKPINTFSRRDFAKLSTLGIAALPFLGFQNAFDPINSATENDLKVHLFSKHLQFLNYRDMSEAAANMGFDGLDLTVRRKGHVLPEQVKDDLPKAVEAMKAYGLQPQLMSTNVWDVNDDKNKVVLETASQLGFTHYRTDWLTYPENQSIQESQAHYAKQAKALEQLNEELGLIGGYQNHSGKHVGAAVWDLLPILEATKGEFLGCQYDIRHAVVEGAGSWELGLQRIKPFINTIVIKDFKWGLTDGKWTLINVPLGEGMVDFKRYFSILKKYKINVPVSLHLEYDLGGAEKGHSTLTISKEEVFKNMTNDLQFLKEVWKQAE